MAGEGGRIDLGIPSRLNSASILAHVHQRLACSITLLSFAPQSDTVQNSASYAEKIAKKADLLNLVRILSAFSKRFPARSADPEMSCDSHPF
jgi:hypothetical protein